MKDRMKLLIAYDGSECADAALEDLQRAGLPRKAEVHILSVSSEWIPAPASYGMVESGFTAYEQEAEKHALGLARQARTVLKQSFPDWEIHAEAATGSPAKLIVYKADELKPDLIVAGSHGRSGLGRLFLGSVSQKVMHSSNSTVRIGRGRQSDAGTPIRLIVGIDGSRGSEAAVKTVAGRHWPQSSEARIVNGFPLLPTVSDDYTAVVLADWLAAEKARVGDAIEKAAGKLRGAGLKVSQTIEEEDARQLLLSEAESWGADCIFVGARGASFVERFLLGSVSSFVASHARCSIEVVREPEE